MKTGRTLAATGAVALLGLLLLSSMRTGRGKTVVPKPRSASELRTASVYDLASAWTTDAEDTLSLQALGGRVQVLALFYARCPSACPMQIRRLQALDASLPAKVRPRVGFVLVTVDPDHDDPAALREYRDKMGLNPNRWTLLRGQPGAVRELAAVLGFGYGKEGTEYFHSNLVTVLDKRGHVVEQQEGLDSRADRLASAIRATQ